MTIDNPIPVFIGIPVMALICWALSAKFPLLQTESVAHADTLPLDGLRGILATSVFFHHAYITYVYLHTGAWTEPASNFYGQLGPTAVTLFFFISGFLFWKKMLQNPTSLSPARLWPNRIRRIMPAYWASASAALVAIAVASGFQLHQSPLNALARTIPWFFVGFPCQPDINGIVQQPITAGVYWTLRVELLLYLLLPAMIWFRKGLRPLLLIALALVANLALYKVPQSSTIINSVADNLERFTSAVVTCFSIGGLAAYLVLAQPRHRLTPILQSHWSALVATALILVHLFFVKGSSTWREPLLLAPAFFMIVSGNSFFGLLTNRPVRCLGQISYSIYIFHGLILHSLISAVNQHIPITERGVGFYWSLIFAIGLVVVSICTLTYWYIERPFFQKRKPAGAGSIRIQPLPRTS
jgi:peptidoglycan/LPS O-acetylase OafA/YrhL